jgi:hypothetical protein
MSLQKIVKFFKMRDLSGDEIETLIGKSPILYSDLKKFSSINELLGKENYCIILYQTSSYTTGHFIAITRGDDGKVRYCDSYGIQTPDEELQFTPFDEPLPRYLTNLLKGVDFESNTIDYQSKNKGISTCGRYASFFCRMRNLSLVQIDKLLKDNQSEFLNNPDNAVCLLTLLSLKDIEQYFE